MSWIPAELADLRAVVAATLSYEGLVLAANAGFLDLIKSDKDQVNGCYAQQFFIQPTFASLLNAPPKADGEVFIGLLTLGSFTDKTYTLQSRIWRVNDTLCLLAEYDLQANEQLNDTLLSLNQDYVKAQFEIIQINLKLKQRERELENSLLQLQTAQKKLVEAEKMSSLSVFVAGVAHEINSPLGVSLGCASLLSKDARNLAQLFSEKSMTQSDLKRFLTAAQQEAGLIQTNLQRIGQLMDKFRQLAVTQRDTSKTQFDLRACLQNVITSFGLQLHEEKVKIRITAEPALEINSFAQDWGSIFTNLILNSLQHGFKGREDNTVHITMAVAGQYLRVDYIDNGIGLSERVKAKIYDPFFTTDMQHGIGLGMHMLYNMITHKMQGFIECDNSAEGGAHFHIEIPL